MSDKENLEPLTTRIPKPIGSKIRVYAARHRVSIQVIVTEALEEYLVKDRKEKKKKV